MKKTRFYQAKKHNQGGYSQHSLPGMKYDKSKLYLFGNHAQLYGCVDDDYNSCDLIQNALEEKIPNTLILGDISNAEMDFYRLGQSKFISAPTISLVQPEEVLAKKQLNNLFQEQIEQSPIVYFETDKMHGVD